MTTLVIPRISQQAAALAAIENYLLGTGKLISEIEQALTQMVS